MTRNVTDSSSVPTDEQARYRLYRLCECAACEGTGKEHDPRYGQPTAQRCPDCRGEGRTRELVATATDPESVGVALVTLGREGEWEGCPIGLLDTQGETGQRWLLRPWQPSPREVTAAAKLLRSQQEKGKT